MQWRVPLRSPIAKGSAAIVFGAIALWYPLDSAGIVIALLAALALAAMALRDLLAPVRLSGNSSGITVIHGFASRRSIGWGEITKIRVDRRARFGLQTELVEIDTEEELHLLTRRELGVRDCDTVVSALHQLWRENTDQTET